ncbi:hypothetical protein [Pseudalkalibacillus sp. SCS-8]|uniref:hypothetical protein n=1 Tax=Pseudalkalibacillus nanhaiensis TaxID=3115291 RepID=UPI0032DA07DE
MRKRTKLVSAIIIGIIVISAIYGINHFSKTWPANVLKLQESDFPLDEKDAIRVADKSIEGFFNHHFTRSVDDSPWDPISEIKTAEGEDVITIQVAQDMGDHYRIEFRHRGYICRQLFIKVSKENGHILDKSKGTSDSAFCKEKRN